ncbi:probable cytochrome P450 301a1, mitochondrial [Malaya genurostris]|uniref:probable cytochrome P450 301a1, mitochondrial n=1 Tax=Malaya genurostris TaxID=325434 RepID=UPI0026F38C56|nr:probable cytochrome P450 301a1, mitochondrial [Malaya genurostris]XP_058463857.1 probable cytochrome P450 301a1, mitochondrial [Malaya genurostris]XP_058463858.1 probable cytochrome P450 301a1, mitochondrial [Malaya genurostris]XP_058463859.1 probable cytochrome P450 301a1, mitochondrial [Malaya genurostris]
MNSTRHRLIRSLNRLVSTSASSSVSPTASATAATGNSNSAGKPQGNKIPSSSYATSTCPHMVEVAEATASINTRLHGYPVQQTPPTIKLENARPYSEVPGPKPLPILGNTWRVFPIIGQYKISDVAMISFLLYEHFGRIVRLGGLIGRPDLLFVYDADEIEKVYRNEGPTPFRPSMPSLVKYKSELRKDFFGDLPGVVGVHGEPWREFRSRVQKPVLQLSTVRRYVTPLEQVTEEFIDRCNQMLDSNQELPDDFDNEIHKWSLECIGLVALDARLGCLEPNLDPNSEPQQIINAAKYALRNVATLELKAPYWRYFPTPLWTKYVNNMDYFVKVCMKYIKNATSRMKLNEGRALDGEPSLLERVIKSGNNEKLAVIMALDLILVGIDTISMAVCSILYQLATRPVEQQKLYEELKRIMPDPKTPLTFQLLDQAHYLKAFIKEVLRVYSTVIGNGRTLQEDTVICGYRIPKGVQCVFPNLVTGTMEEYVTDAQSFKPERWLKPSQGGTGDNLHPFSTLPYGYGARMCLGRRFADLEMQILLAKLLRSYKLEYHHDPLKYVVTFMYAPEGALKFKMTPRE